MGPEYTYDKLTSKMAMKIGSKYDADNLFARHWEQLCNDINYRYIAMRDIIENHAELILRVAKEERSYDRKLCMRVN